MPTFTSRWGFPQLALTDNVDIVADFNTPWASLDSNLYAKCTSTTRPSSPVQGQIVFETDTGFTRKYKGSTWEQVGIAVCTSSTRPSSNLIAGDMIFETNTLYVRIYSGTAWLDTGTPTCLSSAFPANPIAGDSAYATDKNAIAYYTGSAWVWRTLIACTSSTRPTVALAAGVDIYETDTTRFLIYNGTSWEQKAFANYVCTSSTHPASPFTGLEIFETDTNGSAVYNGSTYLYNFARIAQTTLGSAAASITFNSIPAIYSHLMLVCQVKSASTATSFVSDDLDVVVNAGANYNWSTIFGFSTVAAADGTAQSKIQLGAVWTSFSGNTAGAGHMVYFVPNYTGTTFFKGMVGISFASDGGGSAQLNFSGGASATISTAVTSLTFTTNSGSNFVTGSTIELIGIP